MDTPELPIGTLVGIYRIESLIGSGGMGAVYRGIHTKLGRKAALKVLSDSLAADPTYVSRFFHEARIVAEVGHPNIIDIHDFIETESPRRVAYVMELVDGPPLSRVLKTVRLSTTQVINITLQLLDALMAVHRINVVHRDLKPDNILVIGALGSDFSAKPCIKVLDFGIAKVNVPDQQHKTTTGLMLGTPAYMAPEQVAGESVSPATDIYAVGELMYEMLTGKRLFDGPGRQVLRAKMGDQAPTIGLPDELPDRSEFAGLIRACLAPDQRQRPTASALSRSLRVLLGEPRTDTPVALQIEAQPAPYQATLSGMVNTSIRPPDRSTRARVLTVVGLVALLASAMLIGFMMRAPDPITVRAIPLPEEPAKPRPIDRSSAPGLPPSSLHGKPIVAEPPPAPPPPVVVAAPPPPPPVPAKRPAAPEGSRDARLSPRVKKEEKGPLKKGEFPTW